MQFAGLEAHLLDKKRNGNSLEVKFGNQFRKDNLYSKLDLMMENGSFAEPFGYGNALTYLMNDSYLTTKYRFKFKQFGLFMALELHQIFNKSEKSGSTSKYHPFYVTPQVGADWKINEKNKIISQYIFNRTNATIMDVYDQYINTGFRSFSKGVGEFNQLNMRTFIFNYSYGDWGDKFFANTLLICNKDYDFYSTNTTIARNYAQSEKILAKNRSNLMLNSNIDRYIGVIASNLKINFGLSFSEYKNKVNGSDFRSIKSDNLNYGFEVRSGFHGKLNYHFGSKWIYSQITTSITNRFTDNISFLDVFFAFSQRFDIQLQTERYFFGSLDKSNNKYYFMDLNARYVVRENKLTISLSGQNLFNTETFRNYSVSDFSISKMEYRLLPRYLLLKAEYRF